MSRITVACLDMAGPPGRRLGVDAVRFTAC